MGDYSVPGHIRAMKPKGTMVKAISGNYYVYEYRSATRDGKRRTEMGRCIGSIKEGVGFVANGNRAADSEVTSLEYGQYALILSASRGVHGMLARHFNAQDAAAVYAMAVVNCANGAVPMKSYGRHFSMSALSLRFPSLRLGPDAVSTLVDALGRRQAGVLSFEEELCASCGREVAVDGHAIPSRSDLNDLCEAGYRRARLGSEQVNLLVAFDVASGRPVMARVYEGAALDKRTVGDLLGRHDLCDKTFIVGSGFYSAANLETLSSNGCSYVMPPHKGLRGCKEAVADARVDGRFVYRRSKRAPAIECRKRRGPKGARRHGGDRAADLGHRDEPPRGLRDLQEALVGRGLLRLSQEQCRIHVLGRLGLLQGPGPCVHDAGDLAGPRPNEKSLRGGEGQVGGRLPSGGPHGQGEQGARTVGVLQHVGEATEALRGSRGASGDGGSARAYLRNRVYVVNNTRNEGCYGFESRFYHQSASIRTGETSWRQQLWLSVELRCLVFPGKRTRRPVSASRTP